MLTIQINAKRTVIAASSTLQDIVDQRQLKENSFALALNKKFIPRAHYANTFLQEKDDIDIVIAMQGG